MDTKQTQFLQLIGEHKGILFKICKIYQDDADDRNDLLQEMTLQLWLAFDSFRGESKFSSWMYRVALLNGFYYSRFYIFYKAIGRYDLNIKSSLRKIVYEMELNAEIYKTYSFSAMPLSLLTSGAFIAIKLDIIHVHNVFAPGSNMSASTMLWICSTILVSYIITYFLIGLSVRLTYGKYITELKQVMNDLGEEA